MALTVKKATLWRREVENKPGMLAQVLEPLAKAGTDLQVVMGYRYPGNESKAAIELYPVSGKKGGTAAQATGLSASSIPTLLVQGDNKPGLGAVTARALADAGINMSFLVAQVIGRRYTAVFGFETEADASKAATLIKKAATAKKKSAGKMPPRRSTKASSSVLAEGAAPAAAALQVLPDQATP
jgi:hypothetical protein